MIKFHNQREDTLLKCEMLMARPSIVFQIITSAQHGDVQQPTIANSNYPEDTKDASLTKASRN